MKNLLLVLAALIGNTAFAEHCLEINGQYERRMNDEPVVSVALQTRVTDGKYFYNFTGDTGATYFYADGVEREEVRNGQPGTLKVSCTSKTVVLEAKSDGQIMTITITEINENQLKIESDAFALKGTFTKLK